MQDFLKPELLPHYLCAILAFGLILSLFRIKNLNRRLEEEHRKRTLPLLIFGVDSLETGLYLKNDSYCHARDIRIEDFTVIVDYGFKKKLRLQFEPIEMLKAQGKVSLAFRVFDGPHEVMRSDTILTHLLADSFEARLRYRNLENEEFISIVGREKKTFTIKQAGPAAEILKQEKHQAKP
jgi:hypothetical protein